MYKPNIMVRIENRFIFINFYFVCFLLGLEGTFELWILDVYFNSVFETFQNKGGYIFCNDDITDMTMEGLQLLMVDKLFKM